MQGLKFRIPQVVKDVCLLRVLCVVRYRSVWRNYQWSRGERARARARARVCVCVCVCVCVSLIAIIRKYDPLHIQWVITKVVSKIESKTSRQFKT